MTGGAPLYVVPVTMTVATSDGGVCWAIREFVVGENPDAPGLPDLAELKRRVADWKRDNLRGTCRGDERLDRRGPCGP